MKNKINIVLRISFGVLLIYSGAYAIDQVASKPTIDYIGTCQILFGTITGFIGAFFFIYDLMREDK